MDPDTYPLNLTNTIDLLCVPQALGFLVFSDFFVVLRRRPFAHCIPVASEARRVIRAPGDLRGVGATAYYYTTTPRPTHPGTHRVLTAYTHDHGHPGGRGAAHPALGVG